jgi:hypothetical protein
MALQYSPKIVSDGLVMCLDPSLNKSYPATDLPVKNGLVMWMDAADDTTFSYSSGTTVSQWRDKSGFNYHMVPKSSGPTRNAFLNSRKVLAFTASQTIGNDVIDLTSTTSTVFVVSRYVTGTNQRVLTCNLDSGGGNWLLGHWGGYVNQYYAEGWVSYQVYGNDTVWRVYMGDYSGVNTDLANIYSNGTAIVTNSTAASGGLRKLGVNYFSSEMSTCEVAEIVVFNRVLSTAERRLVDTYLGQKWGISNTDRSVFDLSNNNYNGLFGNGTVANMPLYDYYNNGTVKFDGSNDYITTGVSGIVPTSTTAYTVSVWCYRNTNNSSYKELLAQWTTANSGNSFYFGFQNSDVRFTDNWNPITVAGAGNTNVWMNLVGVYTVSNAYIYLNGSLAATKGSGFTYTGTGPLIIGRQGELDAEYFDGNISNVLIYNRSLSATEVSQNYEAQKSRFANSIVQQGIILNLDAGNPFSYAGAGTTWFDVSGNSYNGTLIGSPSYTSNNNGGIIFDSNAKYGTLPTSGLAFGTGQFAIEVWVYSTAAVTNNVIYASQSSNVAGFVALFYPSGLGFSLTDFNSVGVRTTTTHQTAVSQNTWYHVVGIRNASNQYIVYVNGVASTTNATATTSLTTAAPQIASNPATTGERFTGTIASLRLYNRSLSADEVLQNYNATKGRFGL